MYGDVRRRLAQTHTQHRRTLRQLLVTAVVIGYRLLYFIYEVFLQQKCLKLFSFQK